MTSRTLNLIIFGCGIVLCAIIVCSELSELIDSIESNHNSGFSRIKSHLIPSVLWLSLEIFDIVMFCMWIVMGE